MIGLYSYTPHIYDWPESVPRCSLDPELWPVAGGAVKCHFFLTGFGNERVAETKLIPNRLRAGKSESSINFSSILSRVSCFTV